MGTSSTTKIYEDGNFLLALYKQYDGHPDSWGKELKEFIKSKPFVNGIPLGQRSNVFNGAGCFALQLVKQFKNEAGELYATTEDNSQEFNYEMDIISDNYGIAHHIKIQCLEDNNFDEVIYLNEVKE